MTQMDHWIERYLRRLQFGMFLHRAADWLAVFLFTFGTSVLIVKLLLPSLWPHVLWLALASLPVATVAWYFSSRRPYTRTESVAFLDKKLQTGGLLMALSEAPDEEWNKRLPQLDALWRNSLPRYRPARFAKHLGLPLVFAAAACFVPLREVTAQPVLRSAVGRDTSQQLEQMLELIQEADAIEEEKKEELKEEIAKLVEETKNVPLTHEKWETVDTLRQRMQMHLETAEMSTSKAISAAAALASETAGEPLSNERKMQLTKDLQEALDKLAKSGAFDGNNSAATEGLKRLMKNGKFQLSSDPGERDQQLKELQDFLNKESDKLSKCRGKCEGEGMCKSGNCQGNKPGRNGDGKPGRGGVNRGRGDAALTYGDESDESGTKFKETALPPGYLDEPHDDVLGVTLAQPEVAPADSAPRSGARGADAASGNETWNRTLRPRHRNVVRKYFDTK